jgi:hypothetical protein
MGCDHYCLSGDPGVADGAMKQENLALRPSKGPLLNDNDVRPGLIARNLPAGESLANNRDHFFVSDFRLVTCSGSVLMEHFL